jgi:hypothetical protein
VAEVVPQDGVLIECSEVRQVKEIPDPTLFDLDAPYGDPALARATVEHVTSAGVVRDQVLGGTAARLLGLT